MGAGNDASVPNHHGGLDRERGFLNAEVGQLVSEINRIAASTEFNGRKLLNGEGDSINTSIGQKGAKSIDVEIFFLNKNNKSTGFFIFHVERPQKFRTSVRIPPVW